MNIIVYNEYNIIRTGPGAGTNPTWNMFGTQMQFLIQFTTGTVPVAGIVMYITSASFTTFGSCAPIFLAANNTAAAQATNIFIVSAGGGNNGTWTLNTVAPLVASTQYQWYVLSPIAA